MEIRIVKKTLEDDKLPRNVEIILQSLKATEIKSVNAVTVKFDKTITVDKAYRHAFSRNALLFENIAIMSKFLNDNNFVDTLEKDVSIFEIFSFIDDIKENNISLETINSLAYRTPYDILDGTRLGLVKVSKSICNEDNDTSHVLFMIKSNEDGTKEIYLPQIMLFCNYNIDYAMHAALSILHNKITWLKKIE